MPTNKEGFKYVIPKSINKILLLLREEILELLRYKNDRGFWIDVNKNWQDTKTNLVSRSTDKDDIKRIQQDDIYKVATELIQIATFGRILQTDDENKIKNMPKLHLPFFMKQSLGATFTDLYDINTQKAYQKIDEKNKNLNMVRKVQSKSVSHRRQKSRRVK